MSETPPAYTPTHTSEHPKPPASPTGVTPYRFATPGYDAFAKPDPDAHASSLRVAPRPNSPSSANGRLYGSCGLVGAHTTVCESERDPVAQLRREVAELRQIVAALDDELHRARVRIASLELSDLPPRVAALEARERNSRAVTDLLQPIGGDKKLRKAKP